MQLFQRVWKFSRFFREKLWRKFKKYWVRLNVSFFRHACIIGGRSGNREKWYKRSFQGKLFKCSDLKIFGHKKSHRLSTWGLPLWWFIDGPEWPLCTHYLHLFFSPWFSLIISFLFVLWRRPRAQAHKYFLLWPAGHIRPNWLLFNFLLSSSFALACVFLLFLYFYPSCRIVIWLLPSVM